MVYLQKMFSDGDRIKKNEIYKRGNKGKNSPFGHPPIPVYEVEADCFPMSENMENKLDLS